jgi:hypothetical protein
MTCTQGHDYVTVHARCTGCGQLVSYGGPFDLDAEVGPRWRGAPFNDHADTTCRVHGTHRPDTANGSCGSCPTQFDAVRDPASGDLRWFETTY